MLVQAPVQTRSGYGDHARDLLRSLIRMDKFDIMIWGSRWGDTPFIDLDNDRDRPILERMLKEPNIPKQPEIHLQVAIPNEFQKIGKYNIGVTAGIETTHCSAPWLEGMNRMDLVVVPSKHAKDVFMGTKHGRVDPKTKQKVDELSCTVPVEVLFEGVDTNVFHHIESITDTKLRHTLNDIKEDFCFLFVGHWLKGEFFQDRKDVAGLIRVFLETFKNQTKQPALILKTSSATFSVMDRDEIVKKINNVKSMVSGNLPNIYLLHGELTDSEMNSLYNHSKVKAMVSFTKGEGFGRPLLEATMSKKPVIAPSWSGQLDFLSKEHSILLPGQLEKVHQSVVWENIIIPESHWFTTNYSAAGNIMRDVFRNYRYYKIRAEGQEKISREQFSLDKMHEKFVEIFDKNIPEFPEEVKINIPKSMTTKLPKLKPMVAKPTETIKEDMQPIDAKTTDVHSGQDVKPEIETSRTVDEEDSNE